MIQIRQATPEDVVHILALQHDCYPLLSQVSLWRREHLEAHQARFPPGQLVAVADGRVVGHSASFRTTSKLAMAPHSFREITHRGTFAGHDPEGDVLYGAEIMVHPDFRRQGIARQFYEARFAVMRRHGIRFFVAGGRLPGFEDYADQMTPERYVQKVVEGTLKDRVLSSQLRIGLHVAGVLPSYLNDPRSRDNASLLVWENSEDATSES